MKNEMKYLKPIEQKVVDEFIDVIRKLFPNEIKEIILFGSKARGNSQPESDIDVLIVIAMKDKEVKKRISDICWDVMLNNNFKAFISPIIFSDEEYSQYLRYNSSFIHNVHKEGVKL